MQTDACVQVYRPLLSYGARTRPSTSFQIPPLGAALYLLFPILLHLCRMFLLLLDGLFLLVNLYRQSWLHSRLAKIAIATSTQQRLSHIYGLSTLCQVGCSPSCAIKQLTNLRAHRTSPILCLYLAHNTHTVVACLLRSTKSHPSSQQKLRMAPVTAVAQIPVSHQCCSGNPLDQSVFLSGKAWSRSIGMLKSTLLAKAGRVSSG